MTVHVDRCCACRGSFDAGVEYRHRVLCGSAASEADHERLLDGATVDLVVTDPPYGVDVDYGPLVDDSADAIRELMAAVMPLLLRHQRVLLTPGNRLMWDYPRPAWVLAWVHPAGNGANPWGFTTMNFILAYGKDPYLQRGLGSRPDSVVLAVSRENEGGGHPVAKPMKAWEWLIERGSPAEDELLFDPFLGSGTTLIAAHRLRRRCYAIELDPRWVDVALRRYQAHTGERPVLAATGEPVDFSS